MASVKTFDYIQRPRRLNLITIRLLLILLAGLYCLPGIAATQAQINSSSAKVKKLNSSLASTRSSISSLEKSMWSIDQQILDLRKVVRIERTTNRRRFHEAKRDFKRQTFEIERIEKDISLVDFDIEIVQRDMNREQQRFDAMNVFKQRLAENDHLQRQKEYNTQITHLKNKKKPLLGELQNAQDMLQKLQSELDTQKDEVSDQALDADPRIAALNQKRNTTANRLTSLRTTQKSQQRAHAAETRRFNKLVAEFKQQQPTNSVAAATKPSESSNDSKAAPSSSPAIQLDINPGEYTSYVFVISGDQEPDIESTLHLKSWVESYGAKYIEANWNGFGNGQGPLNNLGFQEAFREYIRQIPKQAKLILIGHGLGGGTAIDAATRIAYSEKRTVDFLAALDPIGNGGLRANIVYDTKGSCVKPAEGEVTTNAEYVACIRTASKRKITPNIKYFYNRWQKDAQGPFDFQRQITSLNAAGDKVSVPTASGRFTIENGTLADQRRLFFSGNQNAHAVLLAEEAKVLPKLLVQHLR
ncbi:hypothetical protein FT643_16385 [Ketobacter sp. MCCC 1A13808]|uniref:hypothetical protein n=1 Tax=Ketobacter sp. MCCC 1A13808 TaxID=2602738 RepID=UPI0012EB25C9|nr:hypothetical protein [Ketobacter sp. MCCC 1A13808]MVF13720.1 hypothetical protein [Ketobacter sp. MCCC 1A13808]